ncbi:protease FtsH subunit HflC [Ferrimonas sediminum]|uniref:Protein HflC n=1 Tax=Ferrimonas sediminum TaxID=718193 RepID=A0A1G8MMR6_9GAMM|nr:protease modulator HflC [Ferrimonas sediminum]SDI68630.1 protease FtsH subunit HflC [Ferrimonas sediminum]
MKPISIGAIVVILFLGLSSLFVVSEGERGIVKRFGKIAKDAEGVTLVYEPGIHFKVPLIDTVLRLNARILTLDAPADRFVTSEKKDLMVDSYVKWRIIDFERYFLSTSGGNQLQAEALLQSKINNGLRSEFGTRTISEIVSGSRDELQQEALKGAAESALELGIKVVDVRVKQINLPREVSSSIYDRMRAERIAVAKEHRSQGKEKAEVLRANIDAKVTVMVAEAEKNARTIKGQGDAQAAKIYADAYTQAPEFFAFLRSLDAYSKSFNSKQDVLVVSPDSEFFQYMKSTAKPQ